jgi:uncharacterized membrane protein YhhN
VAFIFLGLSLVFAILNWIAVYDAYKVNRPLEIIAKPAMIVCLLLYFLAARGPAPALTWFGLAILFSALGDIFLLLPGNWLMAGLFAFLLTHICYTIGFNTPLPQLTAWSLLFALTYTLMATRVYRRIAAALTRKGLQNLKAPILAYVIAITLMLLSATLTLSRPDWKPLPAAMVFLGAGLFFLSDINQALYRFEAPTQRGRFIIMLTYQLGQIGLVAGAILQFQ